MYLFAISVRKYFSGFIFTILIEKYEKKIKFSNSSILSFLCKKKNALKVLIFLEILCKLIYFTAQDDLKYGPYRQWDQLIIICVFIDTHSACVVVMTFVTS